MSRIKELSQNKRKFVSHRNCFSTRAGIAGNPGSVSNCSDSTDSLWVGEPTITDGWVLKQPNLQIRQQQLERWQTEIINKDP